MRQTVEFGFKHIEVIAVLCDPLAVDVHRANRIRLSKQRKVRKQNGPRVNAISRECILVSTRQVRVFVLQTAERAIKPFELALSFFTKTAPVIFQGHTIHNDEAYVVSLLWRIQLYELPAVRQIETVNFSGSHVIVKAHVVIAHYDEQFRTNFNVVICVTCVK